MYFHPLIDTIETVEAMRNNVDTMLLTNSFTTEYTIGGTDFRKERIIKSEKELKIFRDECTDFLLYMKFGIEPATSTTTVFW